MIKKPCCSRFLLHKFVQLKHFWTQFKNVHMQGPCSLRPCISRPYCIFIIFISCFLQFFPESFSLFSLVSFPNEECTTTMTTLITGAPVRWVSSILFSSFCWKVGKTDQCECVKRDNWNLFFLHYARSDHVLL